MIRFSKYLWIYFCISAIVLIPGIYSLLRYGLKPAVDFTGGTLLEMRFEGDVSQDALTGALESEHIEGVTIQKSSDNTWLLRLKPQEDEVLAKLENTIASVAGQPAEIVRNETVGPVLGKELLGKTVTAAFVAITIILAYVAYAFKNIKFGVSAIIALVHDLLVVLGVFSLLGQFYNVEVDTLFVTAFLTTMSFSVHDTIVVFDRIREMSRRGDRSEFDALCDKAITETMGRSLANSLTIMFMLLALVLMGGTTTRWFVFALLVGTVSGTYSSPFVATPALILWHRWEQRRSSR